MSGLSIHVTFYYIIIVVVEEEEEEEEERSRDGIKARCWSIRTHTGH